MKKILVVTPRFPFGARRGACEQDRIEGIHLLRKLGYEVRVLVMCYPRHLALVSEAEKEIDARIIPVLYAQFRTTPVMKLATLLLRALVPPFWDGASYEYRNKVVRETLKAQIQEFRPDIVWFDYSNLWPLYDIVQKERIAIVTRSINYEPAHYLGQSKRTIIDYLKYASKAYGERRMLRKSNLVFSITPKEERIYQRMKDTRVVTLPLRRLSTFIGRNTTVHVREKLNIYFIGSNFFVPHMRRGLLFMLDRVNPLLQEQYPNTFTLHVIGGKNIAGHDDRLVAPESRTSVVFHGYVPDLDAVLADMDIAVSPSLIGEGMQQKVFESIVRGIPTITSPRVLAGYPLHNGVHLLTPEPTPEAFVSAIGSLRDTGARAKLSGQAVEAAKQLFSEELYLECIGSNLNTLLKTRI